MALRETVEVTTPVTKKKVVLRGYITGRIKQEIEAVYLADTSFTAGDAAAFKMSGTQAVEGINKAISLIVLSVDGQTENVLDLVLDLPEADYTFVTGEVEKIQRPLVPGKPKNSEPATSGS